MALCLFTVAEVNYPFLRPQARLAVFAMLGMVLCFLNIPLHPRLEGKATARGFDLLLVVLTVLCCGFILVQTEPVFESWWLTGRSLGNRAGVETTADCIIGAVGLVLIVEAARRSLGLALPLLSLTFLLYAYFGFTFPSWLFPHRGYSVERIVAQTFLHTQGIFGIALNVMFTYVFLFVIFGAFLEATGATRFIVTFAQRMFGHRPGGPAKVAVLSSGMMGSLSGSAVANTATTGTFTIPMMRSAGFRPVTAAGIQAAASSGGALMPPVMGAGAYMMLEIVEPPATYLEIIRAALIPAVLYYMSLLLIVHFHARRMAVGTSSAADLPLTPPVSGSPSPSTGPEPLVSESRFQGLVFATGLGTLLILLIARYTPFRAITASLFVIIIISALNKQTRLTWRGARDALLKAARDIVPLVAAAACVGIVIGTVTLTGIGTRLPATILPLAEESLLLALVLIMVSSIILGMGLPSAVCYLLMATLIGPVLGNLGVVPLAAHLFIFYFGMMSMVTPPVALAAYTAASIAGTHIMSTGVAAFRFALVGFTLPYIFVYRPQLLMLDPSGGQATLGSLAFPLAMAILGVTSFAAAIAGQFRHPLALPLRLLMFAAAALLLAPGPSAAVAGLQIPLFNAAGIALFGSVLVLNVPNRGGP